jgi:micrococcal nuclease
VNGDGLVDLFDLVAVLRRYGQPAARGLGADANADGRVDLPDLLLVSSDYGCVVWIESLTQPPTQPPSTDVAYVTGVYDGDSIQVRVGEAVYDVRYIGMDTPEWYECYGHEAEAANREWVLGRVVRLEKDVSETDRYGRLLRYVYAGDTFVNAELVRLGYAQLSTYPPDVKHAVYFLQLQREARDAGRGFWSECVEPLPPAPLCDCAYNRYNCSDFGPQADAQACHEYCQSVRGYDVHRLDGDGDGIACEGNR